MQRHILSVLVEDQPGVLSRVSGLLSSRGHNINSLSVCATEVHGLSRMTIDFETDQQSKLYTIKRIEAVEEVLGVYSVTRERTVEREVILMKLSTKPPESMTDPGKRHQFVHNKRRDLMSLADLFGGEVVDIGSDYATLMLTAWSRR